MEHPLDENYMAAPSPGVAAGLWWANALQYATFNNGDATASLMATLLSTRQQPLDLSQLEAFAAAVGQEVDALLSDDRQGGIVMLSVDYGPSWILRQCAEQVGLPAVMWPWKTSMTVKADRVRASSGYGEPSQVIWGKED